MNDTELTQQERRDRFNRIINGIDMVLMNNIPEVDDSIWENWQDKSPLAEPCEVEQISKDGEDDGLTWFHCSTHDLDTLDNSSCEEGSAQGGDSEVHQWFAVNQNDAEYLQDHNQYITYSKKLDTYFLAITHSGTAWDHTSMVNDFIEPAPESIR